MQRTRLYERPTPDGSRTITITDSNPREQHPADPDAHDSSNDDNKDGDQQPEGAPRLVLNLQGGGSVRGKKKTGQRVVWSDDVVDNEGMGKKKSKICCIYHKPKKFDESSDESSDESDCEGHNHNHAEGSSSSGIDGGAGSTAIASTSGTTTVVTAEKVERNAYEIQPQPPK